MRRYDIDWLRVIAIGLLLIYHVAIGFQSWGVMIGFITTPKLWPELWTPMAMLNVWRIPLLFFVSGMGVYFAMQQRTLVQLFAERAKRILLPFVFGMFAIVPLHQLLWRHYYKMSLTYIYDPGHLWFLANIFIYVVLFAPLFYYFKQNSANKVVLFVQHLFSKPIGLVVVGTAFIGEALLVKPMPFELYAMTWHGFFIGLLAFFFGYCFVWSGPAFWQWIVRWRWAFLTTGVCLYIARTQYWEMRTPTYLIAVESLAWILAVLALSNKHLQRPGKALTYLSQAAYPVYILHMVFLYLGSVIIFPMPIQAPLQFLLVLVFTLAGCFLSFEIIRRIKWIRPLFGLKM